VVADEQLVGEPGRGKAAGRWRLAVLALWVVGGTVAFAVFGAPSPDSFTDLIGRLGSTAPAAYLVASAVLTVLVFPRAVLSVAAGLAFGVALGTVLAVTGTSVGAAGAYFLGRRAGRDVVAESERGGGKLARADAWLGDHGFVAVLYARLIPIMPFVIVNYACGVSSVRFRDFFTATVVGSIPITLALAGLGDAYRDPSSPIFQAAVVMILVLAVAGLLVQRRQRRQA
jgi:uncharacterized membrane protein YdjX (TVP38/TMEM64 family)